MPLLLGTCSYHSLAVTDQRIFLRRTVLLAIATFSEPAWGFLVALAC